MLLEALVGRSRHGVMLSIAPTALLLALVLAMFASGWLPEAGEPPSQLLLVAGWGWLTASVLPRRANAVAAWLRERVIARGGEPDPRQPIVPPTTYESNARNAPALLHSIESVRLSFMRRPGTASRHMLALGGAVLGASTITALAIDATHDVATYATSALAAALAALALSDLYRGRARDARRPWRACPDAWPAPWTVRDGPTKVVGPVWLILWALLFAATIPISKAPTVAEGADRACYLAALLLAVWELRHHINGLAALEATRSHGAVAHWVRRAAPIAWYLLLALQLALVALGALALALAPIDPTAAYLGFLALGLALMVRMLRSEWRRPKDPLVIDSREVAALISERHLERRVTFTLRMLAVSAAAWLFIRQTAV